MLFFFSYARADLSEPLKRFYRDLREAVRSKVGEPQADRVAFRDALSIEPGSAWSEEIAEALHVCKVFVFLHTPTYYTRDGCGKEFRIISNRFATFRGNAAGLAEASCIQPIYWDGEKQLQNVPPEVAGIQLTHEDYGEEYCSRGMLQLARGSYDSKVYWNAIDQIARRIKTAAYSAPLPELPHRARWENIEPLFPLIAQGRPTEASMTAGSGAPIALSNIPIAIPLHFAGRDDSLTAIETALKGKQGRVAITALYGLRGVGKTMLATAYADAHRRQYRATWWIRAQTETTMRADLVALGIRLGWVGANDKEEPALAVVMERLRNEGEGILLIFDNATDAGALRPYLPFGGGARVLVTSNAPDWRSVAEPVEIRVWPANVGADFLIARTGRDGERIAAEALSKALGGLPLAHE